MDFKFLKVYFLFEAEQLNQILYLLMIKFMKSLVISEKSNYCIAMYCTGFFFIYCRCLCDAFHVKHPVFCLISGRYHIVQASNDIT